MGKQLVGWGERERETLLDRETPCLHLAESSLPAITESVYVRGQLLSLIQLKKKKKTGLRIVTSALLYVGIQWGTEVTSCPFYWQMILIDR